MYLQTIMHVTKAPSLNVTPPYFVETFDDGPFLGSEEDDTRLIYEYHGLILSLEKRF